ncbi:cytochrome b/b6 domain-containing protein [Sandarakinorhabdus sp. DWP1-3-1]|uniref:cytochrome b/b6 domain-containing protein n=1 Tax=Sandarakinorhabdus sp. DWP1-3-1 TaxID=2804627 RepID=UPI003CF969CE
MASIAATDEPVPAAPYLFHRHALAVRVTHWINALAIVFLIGTGLNIFNAHPSLYWGKYGANSDSERRWLEIGATGGTQPQGFVRISGITIRTTGVLGVSTGADGRPQAIPYPSWATFPSYRDLATARNFHFFFAWLLILNGLLYLGYSLASGHLRRDLLPRLAELSPRNIGHDIVQHARLKFPRGEDAKRYHILQKLAYVGVVVVLVPGIILTGLTMSPAMNAAWPWLLDLFGGRQSARSFHWIIANFIVLFTVVHLLMVVLAGPYNEIRSMITGKFRVDPEVAK